MEDTGKKRMNEISLARVKTIMKSSPEVENVSQESVFVVAKATELFIKYMAEEAVSDSGKAETVEYKHVSQLVESREELGFLREIVPQKMTLGEIEEYHKKKGLKVKRPGTSASNSDVSFSSDEEILQVEKSSCCAAPEQSTESETTPVSPKDGSQISPAVSTSNGRLPGVTSVDTTQTRSSQERISFLELMDEDMEPQPSGMEVDSTEVSIGKCLGHKQMSSPMTVVSISTGSRTPSPSPSYSSLSPDVNSVVHVDAESFSSSDCEIIG